MIRGKLVIGMMMAAMCSCKSSRPGAESTQPAGQDNDMRPYQQIITGEVETTDGARQQEQLKEQVWRLIVSFISIGEGTDSEAKRMFDAYLHQWKASGQPRVNYIAVPWGKEGEVDFCFTLDQLNARQQQQFIDGMKEQLRFSSLIRIYENTRCVNIR
jgi:hypothetical protein